MRSLILILALLPVAVSAQQADTDLASPYQATHTFLHYQQEATYNLGRAAKPFLREGVTAKQARRLATQLKQVLDAEGHYIDLDELPHDRDFVDSTYRESKVVLVDDLPSVYLEKVGDRWLFSKETVASIPGLHADEFPLGLGGLMNWLPKLGSRKVLGLHQWQLIALLILVLLSVLVHLLFTFLFRHIIYNILKRQGYAILAQKLVLPVARPVSLFAVFLLLVVFVRVLQLPVESGQYIIKGLKAALPFFATLVFYRLSDILALYFQKRAEKTASNLDDQLVPIVRKTLKTFVVIVGGLFILQNLDIPILPLLTGLSIGGLAFALAAQDTIKNFFGSLMIFIDRPFQVGDWITSGDVDGTVEEVGFRSTRVRSFRNSVIYVPNGVIADRTIDNHGLRVYRRFYTRITITYDTPPDVVNLFVEGLRQIVQEYPDTLKDNYHVYLNDLGASALEVMFYIFFEVPDWGAELRCRHDVIVRIMKLAETLGVRFAYPTQTLHIENAPGQKSLTPEPEEFARLQAKMQTFFQKG